jgi:hypothetical protein
MLTECPNMHWEGSPLLQMVLRKLDLHRQKIEIRHPSLTLYKNQVDMNQKPEYEAWNYETARRKPLSNTVHVYFVWFYFGILSHYVA